MQSVLLFRPLKVLETNSIVLIEKSLQCLLDISDIRLKSGIIQELVTYLKSRFLLDFKIKAFIAYRGEEEVGFVIAQLDPHYKSYGRKCATFGWLIAPDLETCKILLNACEEFARSNKIRRLRGNINFPKGIGGFGMQISGFKQQILYGVPFRFSTSNSDVFLPKLGYKQESLYSCMKVNSRTWKSGRMPPNDVRFEYVSFKELKERKHEILELARNSFYSILPDTTGGEERFDEILNIQAQVPSNLYKFKKSSRFIDYAREPSFLDAWNACEMNKIASMAPLAVDRKTGEIVGVLLGIPDMYETWLGRPLTRVNIDTALVRKDYMGRGIFSALNNIGQLTCRMFGIEYFEGTSIWSNNMDAVNSIFPHCNIVRTHAVFQKNITR